MKIKVWIENVFIFIEKLIININHIAIFYFIFARPSYLPYFFKPKLNSFQYDDFRI